MPLFPLVVVYVELPSPCQVNSDAAESCGLVSRVRPPLLGSFVPHGLGQVNIITLVSELFIHTILGTRRLKHSLRHHKSGWLR